MLWISPDDDEQPYGYSRRKLVDTKQPLETRPEPPFPYYIEEEQAENGKMTINFNRGFRWTMFVLNDVARSHLRHMLEAANRMAGIWASLEYRRHPTVPAQGEFIARMPYTHPFDRERMVVAHGKDLAEVLRNLADEVERTGNNLTAESAEMPIG